jgi:hypothetical protein
LTRYKKLFRYRLPVSPPRKRTKTSSSTPNLKSPSTRTPSLWKKSLSISRKFNLHLCQEQLRNVRVSQFLSCFSWDDWFCESYTSYTRINYHCKCMRRFASFVNCFLQNWSIDTFKHKTDKYSVHFQEMHLNYLIYESYTSYTTINYTCF